MLTERSAIPFNKLTTVGNEQEYVLKVLQNNKLSGDGEFNKKCADLLKSIYKSSFACLTPSCTAALEMAYVLIDLQPGDEVILPSYTFTSTATAVSLFGAVPVFVEVDNTFNIDINSIKQAITDKTKAVCVVHYAGQSCDVESLKEYLTSKNIYLIEDAAQAIGATYKNKPLGSVGDIAAISFHETKNIGCGEGGAILVNNPKLASRAELIRDKGTNRQKFLRGEVDKYTWVDKGSSYLLGELAAAYLLGQLEKLEVITQKRRDLYNLYSEKLQLNAKKHGYSLPVLNNLNKHNAHIFYLIVKDENQKNIITQHLKQNKISAVSHYVPLHSSTAGQMYGRASGDLSFTNTYSDKLLRLPLFFSLTEQDVEIVSQAIISILDSTVEE